MVLLPVAAVKVEWLEEGWLNRVWCLRIYFLCKYINGLSFCFVVAANAGTLESRGLCSSWLGLAYNKRPFFWY